MAAIFEALQRAASQDPTVFRPASEQLQQWEVEPGYHLGLVVCRMLCEVIFKGSASAKGCSNGSQMDGSSLPQKWCG
jgi:hypothetical protein